MIMFALSILFFISSLYAGGDEVHEVHLDIDLY